MADKNTEELIGPRAQEAGGPAEPGEGSGPETERKGDLAENLEKVVALNLDNDEWNRSRYSPALIKLISVAAALAALLLFYACGRLLL